MMDGAYLFRLMVTWISRDVLTFEVGSLLFFPLIAFSRDSRGWQTNYSTLALLSDMFCISYVCHHHVAYAELTHMQIHMMNEELLQSSRGLTLQAAVRQPGNTRVCHAFKAQNKKKQ